MSAKTSNAGRVGLALESAKAMRHHPKLSGKAAMRRARAELARETHRLARLPAYLLIPRRGGFVVMRWSVRFTRFCRGRWPKL
jgi:hypothetical protein